MYKKYITKKRTRFVTVQGKNINLPYGTICDTYKDYITYKGELLCVYRSQNGKDYFWGYDEEHPQEEIERQKLAEKINKMSPQGDFQELSKSDNPWKKYGDFIMLANGIGMWQWKEETLALPTLMLKRIEYCIENNTMIK